MSVSLVEVEIFRDEFFVLREDLALQLLEDPVMRLSGGEAGAKARNAGVN